jgi:hypothetical protein
LIALQEARQVMRSGAIAPQAFSDLGRSQTTLLAALPARYTEVLHDLLDRLESSALFADESCSFSQGDLIDHLQGWLEQAARQLKKWQMPPA